MWSTVLAQRSKTVPDSRRRVSAPFSALLDNEVFAVDERSAQLIVRSMAETVVINVAGQEIVANTTAGVAVVNVTGLEPDTLYSASIADDLAGSLGALDLRTRPSLGSIHARFATVSDIHLGTNSFGGGRSITDDHVEPYPLRCGRAALAEASEWGAEVLLVKGDLTDTGAVSDWDLAKEMFADATIPFMFTPGNHDVWKSRDLDPAEGAGLLGLSDARLHSHDLDGIRLVLADTSKPNRGSGDLARSTEELLDVAAVDDPVFLGLHHNIQRAPVTWFWPPGIPSTNAMPVVDSLAKVNPRVFISSGHTHRNRAHWLGPNRNIPFTEVSATSDYPGVWAAYEVGERGVRQTVRRISHHDATSWTERTRAAMFGIWPRWSQGRLVDRCVDLLDG